MHFTTSNEEPAFSIHVLNVFYDFETTQNTKRSDNTSLHVPNLVCFNSSVPNVRIYQILTRIAFCVEKANTRSRTTQSEICYVICSNLDLE